MTSALNARTAAEAIRQREFDLVLLDINLPDGNGFELCKLIKPQHPNTRQQEKEEESMCFKFIKIGRASCRERV